MKELPASKGHTKGLAVKPYGLCGPVAEPIGLKSGAGREETTKLYRYLA